MNKNFAFLTCMLLLLLAPRVHPAAIEDLQFDTPEQAARYKKLTDEMRCPMCLNTNLSGSDAPIAADLRAEIYDQIKEGRSDEEIMDFMVSRYGDFINYRPRLTPGTFFLWFGPAILLVLGLYIVRRMMQSSQAQATERSLSAEENSKLQSYLSSHTE